MFTVKPSTPGFFWWKTEGLDYTKEIKAANYWEYDITTMALNFIIRLNSNNIKSKNPHYRGDILSIGSPYYFYGRESRYGNYDPNLIAICIDIFHSLVTGNGYKSNLED
ncbi:hypothetical protein CBF34_04465 [Vagococcus penaei]|uniref:hypothetical protein n=1 Tax=Vagococcus penaei TaxID=633807 RepID=UPI000F8919A5|nr:hypothetical protein [Vagococcus penaei]RSU04053.1 hypothetical protein CBF34_04465 [Vagococcus penaei]